jgi:phosphinothricin acetyltransferase
MMENLNIRFAEEDDLPDILDIFNQAIRSRNACGFMEEVSLEERREWFSGHDEATYPIYTAELNGTIVGYGSLSAYRPGRKAMILAAEVSFFLDFTYHKKGIGSALLSHMLSDCHRLGIESLIAILLSTNNGSIALLKKYGFDEWGRMPGIIHFEEKICDHLYYGKKIN